MFCQRSTQRHRPPYRAPAGCFLLVLFLFTAPIPGNAAEEGVRNVRFAVQGQRILVSYDLMGKGEYQVGLGLFAHGGNRVATQPRSLSGDVGRGVRPGPGKQITWEALQDVPALEGDDYVFEVRAVRPGGTSKWVWIGGLGVAAGGGAAVASGALGGGAGGEEKGTIVIDVPDPEE